MWVLSGLVGSWFGGPAAGWCGLLSGFPSALVGVGEGVFEMRSGLVRATISRSISKARKLRHKATCHTR